MQLLKGYRVLDFGRYIAAPYCGFLLAQLGAEVIRIERPGGSEDRFFVPITTQGEGTMYQQMNANKKGITLDLASPEGKVLTQKLIATADIVIANLPPKTMKALALDYDSLQAIKKDIILVANTAFGSDGPFANRIGFDGIAQAISGANFFSGFPDQPIRCTVNYLDFSTAFAAAFGTLAAVMHRMQTGEGQVVETSLLGTALTLNNSMLMEQAVTQANRVPKGNKGQLAGPADLFKTKDGYIVILVAGPYMFKRCTRLLNKPEWLEDERFKDDTERGKHNDFLCKEMEAWCVQRTTEEALLDLEKAKLPAGPVLNFQETLDNPIVQSLNHFEAVPYQDTPVPPPIAKAPVKLSKTPLNALKAAPAIGAHNELIYGELGLSKQEIEVLRLKGII